MNALLPNLPFALEANDNDAVAPRLARVRMQVAVVRMLADQVEHLARTAAGEDVGDQLIEELARLGCRLLEAAGALASAPSRRDSALLAHTALGPAE